MGSQKPLPAPDQAGFIRSLEFVPNLIPEPSSQRYGFKGFGWVRTSSLNGTCAMITQV